ncbi:MAG: response regulator, partial [Myxococcales bacterium]
ILEEAARHSSAPEQRRVLVVDDEAVVRHLLTAMLKSAGIGVEVAETAAQGMARLHKGGIRVALVDKNLPDGTGLDIIKKAKTFAPETEFILMTGYGDLEIAVRAMDAGATGYISKPFDVNAVRERVEQAFERSEQAVRNAWLVRRLQELASELELARTELGMMEEIQTARLEQVAAAQKTALDAAGSIADRALIAASEQLGRVQQLETYLAQAGGPPVSLDTMRDAQNDLIGALARLRQTLASTADRTKRSPAK